MKKQKITQMRCPECGEGFLTEEQSRPYAIEFDKLLKKVKLEAKAEERKRIIKIIKTWRKERKGDKYTCDLLMVLQSEIEGK